MSLKYAATVSSGVVTDLCRVFALETVALAYCAIVFA